MLDEITLDISIRRDALAFATRVYVNERQLRSEAAKLTLALEHVFDAPERQDVLMSCGPMIPHSPSFNLAIRFDRLGHVQVAVSMVAAFPNSAPLRSDTCTVNLVSDLASLDSFAAQLSGLSKYDNSTAQFPAD